MLHVSCCPFVLLLDEDQKRASAAPPHIQGNNIIWAKYDPKCFKTRQIRQFCGHISVHIFALYGGGWGLEMIPQKSRSGKLSEKGRIAGRFSKTGYFSDFLLERQGKLTKISDFHEKRGFFFEISWSFPAKTLRKVPHFREPVRDPAILCFGLQERLPKGAAALRAASSIDVASLVTEVLY